ncbi:NAC domain protein NAC6 [Striga asiatica]|uniref:NAC domain protein NAC6 n=1 Tax=Striga asiatica TaxID=4170 RepID=A0A5A7R0C3_STRAF|nr:NAC domain protein NAC6 [Striga asiatica]
MKREEWVICRIFHKIGDKKSPTILQGLNYFTNNTTSSNSLPPLLEPLLESQTHLQDYNNNPPILQTLNQNPILFHTQQQYQSDLKTLINPLLVSQCDPFEPNNNLVFANEGSNNIILPKPLLSTTQDFTFKELSNAISKQCKKEADIESGAHGPFLFGPGFDNAVDDHHHVMLTGPGGFKWW